MNWKEEALQRLTDYKPMCASVSNIRTELKRLEMEAVSVSSGIQQFSSGRGCQEDRQLNNLIRRQELKQALQTVRSQRCVWLPLLPKVMRSIT